MWYVRAAARALVPALIAASVCIFLARNEQVREYLAFFLESLETRSQLDIILVLAIATATALNLTAITTSTTLLYATHNSIPGTTPQRLFIFALAALIGILPVLGVILCVSSLLPPQDYFSDPRTIAIAEYWNYGNYAILAALIAIGTFFVVAHREYSAIRIVSSPRFLAAVSFLVIALSVPVLFFPVRAAATFGVLTYFLLFISLLFLAARGLFFIQRRVDIPAGAIVVSAIVILLVAGPTVSYPIAPVVDERTGEYLTSHDAPTAIRTFKDSAKQLIGHLRNINVDPVQTLLGNASDAGKAEAMQKLVQAQQDFEKFVTGEFSTVPVLRARGVPPLAEAFGAWLRARAGTVDAASTSTRKFPVFLVAAKGGGFYAAYHAALTLARLQDLCPQFRDHVFVISGVSGGSLGAGVFAAISDNIAPGTRTGCAAGGPPTQDFETAVHDYFQQDLLSPLMTAFLFHDIPRLIIPVMPQVFHRGAALEASFIQAFDAIKRPGWTNPLGEPFFSRWDPERHTPALIFNSVHVSSPTPIMVGQVHFSVQSYVFDLQMRLMKEWNERGAQEVAHEMGVPLENMMSDPALMRQFQDRAITWSLEEAQKEFAKDKFVEQMHLLDIFPDINISLSAAISVSARFPFVTPSAAIVHENGLPSLAQLNTGNRLQLADGGYLDNSGLGTVHSVLKELENARALWELPGVEVSFHVISFADDVLGPKKTVYDVSEQSEIVSESVVPLRTMMEMRAVSQASQKARLMRAGYFPIEFTLFDAAFDAVLTWSLSKRTKAEIAKRSGAAPEEAADDKRICCDKLGRTYIPNLSSVQKVMDILALGQAPSAGPGAEPAPAAEETRAGP